MQQYIPWRMSVAPPHTLTVVLCRISGRVFVLAPATIVMPPPMTMAMALGPAATGKPLYLFGWPFPVPALDAEDDEQEVATGACRSRRSYVLCGGRLAEAR